MFKSIDFSGDLQICCSKNKVIDLDALNFIASGICDKLCVCSYSEKKGNPTFSYESSELDSLDSQKKEILFSDFIEYIRAVNTLIEISDSDNLILDNYKLSKECIFTYGDTYKFIYVPIIHKQVMSIKNFVIKSMNYICIKDERVHKFIKALRKCRSDEQVKYCLEDFLKSYTLQDSSCYQTEGESETTLLSGANIQTDESETTLLSETNIQIDESETTLLSGMNMQRDELETTVLSQSDYTCSDNSETVVGEERITEFYQDAASEYETTVLTSQPEYVSPIMASEIEDDYILVLVRSSTGERILVKKSVFKIGKDINKVDYVLLNDSVSRHHASVVYEAGAYYIMDNNSTNGTMIEGIKLQAQEKAELGNGYIISLGNESFQAILERR